METKTCTGCDLPLPLERFYKNSKGRGGLSSKCKGCHSAYSVANAEARREWRLENKKKNEAAHAVHPALLDPSVMKMCRGCHVSKPAADFHASRGESSGLQSRCKECTRAWRRTKEEKLCDKRYAAKPHAKSAIASRQRKYNKSEAGKQSKKRHAEKHPDRVFARKVLQLALRMGQLARPEKCECCGQIPPPMHDGRTGIQGHHPDYSKPLDVEWLCCICHQKAGKGTT